MTIVKKNIGKMYNFNQIRLLLLVEPTNLIPSAQPPPTLPRDLSWLPQQRSGGKSVETLEFTLIDSLLFQD